MTTRLFHPKLLILSSIFALLIAACGGSGGGSSGGGNGPPVTSEWLIPQNEVVDGGPGPDGIPSIDDPQFESVANSEPLNPGAFVIGIKDGDTYKAYSHNIMNWHEIVNDGPASDPFTMSYCPLTGTAIAWKGDPAAANPDFGVSGLLYNSNLILYDRETGSLWAQMRQQSINGPRIREFPEQIQVIETSWGTWRAMYPDSMILTEDTGANRDYDDYPYGDYLTSTGLLFPANNRDNRMHPKERVIGISEGSESKVFQLYGFGDTTIAINEQFGTQQIVVVGNSASNFAAIYNRTMPDGTVLNFTAINGQLPNVLLDDEGNVWDIFGDAVSGPRAGEQLGRTNAYIAMWFAWTAFFPSAEIHFNIS
jgi:hypothetical protein